MSKFKIGDKVLDECSNRVFIIGDIGLNTTFNTTEYYRVGGVYAYNENQLSLCEPIPNKESK